MNAIEIVEETLSTIGGVETFAAWAEVRRLAELGRAVEAMPERSGLNKYRNSRVGVYWEYSIIETDSDGNQQVIEETGPTPAAALAAVQSQVKP